MPTDSSKRVLVATSTLTTPQARRYGITHAYGMDLSSRVPDLNSCAVKPHDPSRGPALHSMTTTEEATDQHCFVFNLILLQADGVHASQMQVKLYCKQDKY